jgi:hypothetical protein
MKTEKEFLLEYPWIHPTNIVTGEKIEFKENEKPWTELFTIPIGWKLSFVEGMLSEIDQLIKESNYQEKYRVYKARQISGRLIWEDNFSRAPGVRKEAHQKHDLLVKKYQDLSSKSCIFCGKEAHPREGMMTFPSCLQCESEKNKNLNHKKKK